jgi:hypothetical protein
MIALLLFLVFFNTLFPLGNWFEIISTFGIKTHFYLLINAKI